MRASRVFLVILLMAVLGLCAAGPVFAQAPAAAPPAPAAAAAPAAPAPKIDTGDTAWVLMSSALVLLM
ncbi:MAG: ammonia channel protein, partial [Candidatus Rokubacteria bacterium]|nr:ammonia channel protein [Candidatus Rokubacteria bacterium]